MLRTNPLFMWFIDSSRKPGVLLKGDPGLNEVL